MSYSKANDLKIRIKDKFKTIKNFSRLANLNNKELYGYFCFRMAKSKIDEYEKLLEKLIVETPVMGNPQEIDAYDREYIRSRIALNYKTFGHFVVDNPSFSKPFISNIISGKRVRKDERFKRLKEAVDNLQYDASKFIEVTNK